MGTRESGEFLAKALGARLRAARKHVGMTQEALGSALGLNGAARHVYVGKLERGELPGVSFRTLVRYLEACRVPVGKFMLELAQSGAFGEAEAESVRGFAAEKQVSDEQAKRAKARLVHEKRWEREAQDAEIIAKIWTEVQTAIQPVLAREHPTRRLLAPYLAGVRALYREWKQATRVAVGRDSTADVQAAFDRIEQAGVRALVPAAVRKMREVVFERLMEPQGGKT
jgi:transcriptional regulator with XRE-family HTH domain